MCYKHLMHFSFSLTTVLCDKNHRYTHFADEQTEAQINNLPHIAQLIDGGTSSLPWDGPAPRPQ